MKRDPIVSAVFSLLVPFYEVYWILSTNSAFQRRKVKNTPSTWLVASPFLILCGLLVVQVIVLFLNTPSGSASLATLINAIGFAAGIGAIIMVLLAYMRFCQAVEAATKRAVNGGLLMVLFLFISPVAVYWAQDKINKTLK